MASFSFGAGNLAKLARIPLYALGRIATWVIPRRDRWVFGCGAGIGDGALALYDVATRDGVDALWLVDNDRDEADARARGIPTLRKMSLRGFWATARARVLVVTHGLGDVNRYATGGAFLAQLWHGIPLKRIGLDSPETLRLPVFSNSRIARSVMRRLYASTMSAIDVIPVASHLIRGRIESAFGLDDDRVIVTGEPRVDVLSSADAATRSSNGRAVLTAAVGELPTRVVLYAPTWRDGAVDPAIPTAAQWSAIVAMLERVDAVLLIRSHPLGAGQYRPPLETDRVRLIGSDVVRDVSPVLPAVDLLITDYSSILFDIGLVPAGVVYLAPDAESYARTRGFYGTYAEVAGDDYATTWTQAIAQVEEFFTHPDAAERRIERATDLSARVHDFRDGNNTQRVYGEIQKRLTERVRGQQ